VNIAQPDKGENHYQSDPIHWTVRRHDQSALGSRRTVNSM
jgi:hypothetical protein